MTDQHCTSSGRASVTSTQPDVSNVFAVVWDREAVLWHVTIDGEPIADEAGNRLGWARFNDAYDAKDAYEREARRAPQASVTAVRSVVPTVGAWVVDTRNDRVAVVTDVLLGRLYLRKLCGGVEWDAMPAHVRPATEQERLSARVAEANLRSRIGGAA
jgi:hypothetical protein